MRKPMGFLSTLVLGLASAIVSIGPVRAAPVTYTEQATATGSLDGVDFTNASILLTMTNDTTNVISDGSGDFGNTGTATVSVGGGPSETFTDSIEIFLGQSVPAAGFGDLTMGFTILDTNNVAFSTYDLTTSIGPISGLAGFFVGLSFPTSSGPFIIDSVAGDSTFTAVVSTAVPEPSSLMLLGVAFASFGLLRSRRTQPLKSS